MSTVHQQARPTVQLLHELPDGSTHVDWLIAQDPDARSRLLAFRLPARVDRLAPGGDRVDPEALVAERIGDHRAVYLSYEGPLADAPGRSTDRATGGQPDRGRVRRLAEGHVIAWTISATGWRLTIVWADPAARATGSPAPQEFRLEPRGANRWAVWRV